MILKKIKRSRKLILLPILIIILWVLALLTKNFIYSPVSPLFSLGATMLIEEQPAHIFADIKTAKLLKGKRISGKFKASENNLGMFLLRFNNFNKINSDTVRFRIKGAKDKNWYYENNYKVNQFQPNQYFTFGFPIIVDSKGITYLFELESLSGKPNDAIGLSAQKPYAGAVYQFSFDQLANNWTELFKFVGKKLVFAIKYTDFSKPLLTYPVLLFFFLLIYFFWEKRNNIYYKKICQYSKYCLMLLFTNTTRLKKYLLSTIPRQWKKLLDLYKKMVYSALQVKENFYKHEKKFIFIGAFLIFATALIMRLAYYFNSENFNDFIYAGLGGNGDYDVLARFSWRFLENKDHTTLVWSFADDYTFLVRLFSFFFYIFGFVEALNYLSYFTIFLSSIATLAPFFLLSYKKKKFSVGGLIASFFLAINPLSITLAVGRIVDTGTSFLFSIFIFLFILAADKKNYLLAILLGFFGFIDGLNRGLMLFNDGIALFLFGIYYIMTNKDKYNKYAFLPFLSFLICYSSWSLYFYKTFNITWFLSPKNMFNYYFIDSIHTFVDRTQGVQIGLFNTIFNYLLLVLLMLIKLFKLLSLHLIPVLIMLVIFAYKNKPKQKDMIWLFLSAKIIILLFLFIHLIKKMPIFNLSIDTYPIAQFINLTPYDYVRVFMIAAIVILFKASTNKKIAISFLIIILPYVLLLTYGFLLIFSDRHFIQVIIISFIYFGLIIDQILKNDLFKKNSKIITLLQAVFILLLSIFVLAKITKTSKKFYLKILDNRKERAYLEYAQKYIPVNGIILAGIEKENLIRISNYTHRSVIFNIANTNPFLIKYGKDYFHIPFNQTHKSDFFKATIYDINSSDLDITNILQNTNEFKKYKFFILDYGVERWMQILSDDNSGHPFFPVNKFTLKRINNDKKRRPIYKLSLIR